MKLAGKLGTVGQINTNKGNYILASQVSNANSTGTRDSIAKYSESFDSYVEGEELREGEMDPRVTGDSWKSEKCTYCGRTFAPGRLSHHEPSCRNAHSFGKVVPFDTQRKRVAGTQMEFSPRCLTKPATPSKTGTPSPIKPGSSQSSRERRTLSSSNRPSSSR